MGNIINPQKDSHRMTEANNVYALSEEELREATKLADKGDTAALQKLGTYHLLGRPRPDYSKAYRYFRKAADQDDVRSMYYLGEIYYHGWGIGKDENMALEYFDTAADDGDRDALYALGMMYLKGDIVDRNVDKALDYLMSASEKGQTQAHNAIGAIYDEGTCVDRDPFKAREFFLKGVKAGDKRALVNMTILEAKERSNGTKGWNDEEEAPEQ